MQLYDRSFCVGDAARLSFIFVFLPVRRLISAAAVRHIPSAICSECCGSASKRDASTVSRRRRRRPTPCNAFFFDDDDDKRSGAGLQRGYHIRFAHAGRCGGSAKSYQHRYRYEQPHTDRRDE